MKNLINAIKTNQLTRRQAIALSLILLAVTLGIFFLITPKYL